MDLADQGGVQEVTFEAERGGMWRHRWEEAVWRDAPDDPGALAILLALGRFADWRDGSRCFPAAATLAKAARMSERSARAKLNALEAAGWITKEETPGRATLYHLHPPTPTPANSAGVGLQNLPGCGVETTANLAGGSANLAGGVAEFAADHDHDHGYRSENSARTSGALLHLDLSAFLKFSFKEAGRELEDEDAADLARGIREAAGRDGEQLRAWIVSKLEEIGGRSYKVADKGAAKILRQDAKRALQGAPAPRVKQEAAPTSAPPMRGAPASSRWMLDAEEVAAPKPRAKVIDLASRFGLTQGGADEQR